MVVYVLSLFIASAHYSMMRDIVWILYNAHIVYEWGDEGHESSQQQKE